MSVNDKWHYCHNCEVLVGSRAMRDRHLRLLGYIILQVSYQSQLTAAQCDTSFSRRVSWRTRLALLVTWCSVRSRPPL